MVNAELFKKVHEALAEFFEFNKDSPTKDGVLFFSVQEMPNISDLLGVKNETPAPDITLGFGTFVGGDGRSLVTALIQAAVTNQNLRMIVLSAAEGIKQLETKVQEQQAKDEANNIEG